MYTGNASINYSSDLGINIIILFCTLIIGVVYLIAYYKIISKAGYNGCLWLLLGLIPVLNVILFLVFAFGEWPIEKELKRLHDKK